MWKNDRRRGRIRIIKTWAGLLLIIVLAAVALGVPELMFSLNDKKTFAKQEGIHMELTRYEKEGAFAGQLFSLSLFHRGKTMRSVHMEETNDRISNEELTQIIQSELYRMNELGVLVETQKIQAQDLISRELYISYMDDQSTQRDGITFWKVRYQKPQEDNASFYDLEVIMDMEYHRLYGIKLSNEIVEEKYEMYVLEQEKSSNKSLKIKREERTWNLISSMANYYKLSYEEHELDMRLAYDTNSAADSASAGITEVEGIENIPIEIFEENVYKLIGAVVFRENIDKEQGDMDYCLLYMTKEYGIKEGQTCVYVGISQLEQILQL